MKIVGINNYSNSYNSFKQKPSVKLNGLILNAKNPASDVFIKSASTNPIHPISFCAAQNESQTDFIFDFGTSLYEKIKADKNTDVNKEIQDFLKNNNMQGIEIKRLDELEQVREVMNGCFVPKYNKDIECKGGTLYLSDIDKDDIKSVAAGVGGIVHELTHAYQYLNNKGLEMFKSNRPDKLELAYAIICFVRDVETVLDLGSELQMTPLHYVAGRRDEYGVSGEELNDIEKDISKYGVMFPKRSVKIGKDTTLKAFGCKNEEDFAKIVAADFSNIIAIFNKLNIPEMYKNKDVYKMIQSYSAAYLRNEAEAYEMSSKLNKYHCNLPLTETTLDDLIPTTYNMVADALEKIDVRG